MPVVRRAATVFFSFALLSALTRPRFNGQRPEVLGELLSARQD